MLHEFSQPYHYNDGPVETGASMKTHKHRGGVVKTMQRNIMLVSPFGQRNAPSNKPLVDGDGNDIAVKQIDFFCPIKDTRIRYPIPEM